MSNQQPQQLSQPPTYQQTSQPTPIYQQTSQPTPIYQQPLAPYQYGPQPVTPYQQGLQAVTPYQQGPQTIPAFQQPTYVYQQTGFRVRGRRWRIRSKPLSYKGASVLFFVFLILVSSGSALCFLELEIYGGLMIAFGCVILLLMLESYIMGRKAKTLPTAPQRLPGSSPTRTNFCQLNPNPPTASPQPLSPPFHQFPEPPPPYSEVDQFQGPPLGFSQGPPVESAPESTASQPVAPLATDHSS